MKDRMGNEMPEEVANFARENQIPSHLIVPEKNYRGVLESMYFDHLSGHRGEGLVVGLENLYAVYNCGRVVVYGGDIPKDKVELLRNEFQGKNDLGQKLALLEIECTVTNLHETQTSEINSEGEK